MNPKADSAAGEPRTRKSNNRARRRKENKAEVSGSSREGSSCAEGKESPPPSVGTKAD